MSQTTPAKFCPAIQRVAKGIPAKKTRSSSQRLVFVMCVHKHCQKQFMVPQSSIHNYIQTRRRPWSCSCHPSEQIRKTCNAKSSDFAFKGCTRNMLCLRKHSHSGKCSYRDSVVLIKDLMQYNQHEFKKVVLRILGTREEPIVKSSIVDYRDLIVFATNIDFYSDLNTIFKKLAQ